MNRKPGVVWEKPWVDEWFWMEIWVNPWKTYEPHPDIRDIIEKTQEFIAWNWSVSDQIAAIVPWIFDGPGPDTSNVKYLYGDMDKMIQTWISINKTVSMAHLISFVWIDLWTMKISNIRLMIAQKKLLAFN